MAWGHGGVGHTTGRGGRRKSQAQWVGFKLPSVGHPEWLCAVQGRVKVSGAVPAQGEKGQGLLGSLVL